MKIWAYSNNGNFLRQEIFTDRSKAYEYLFDRFKEDGEQFKRFYCDTVEEYIATVKSCKDGLDEKFKNEEDMTEDGISISFYEEAPHCLKCFLIKESKEDINMPETTNTPNPNVYHPSHYQNEDGHECIDVIRKMFGDEVTRGFCKGNAFKYRFRAGKKKGNSYEQDIEKAEWYEDYLFKMDEEDKKTPDIEHTSEQARWSVGCMDLIRK